MRTMAFTARKPSFVATCNGPSSRIQGLLAKVQALTAPIKSTVSQVYSEFGGCLTGVSTGADETTWDVDGLTETTEVDKFRASYKGQFPKGASPLTPEVKTVTLAGTGTECTIAIATTKLGKDVPDTAVITLTGDFEANPVNWGIKTEASDIQKIATTSSAFTIIKGWK